MYRDHDEAAERRIEDLELRLKDQAEQIVELERRLDQRDDYVEALSRKLDGRSGSAARLWRTTAIALLVALTFVMIWAQSRGHAAPEERAAGPRAETEAPLLADPVTAPGTDEPTGAAGQAIAKDEPAGEPDARTARAPAPHPSAVVVHACASNDLMCQAGQRRAGRTPSPCRTGDPLCQPSQWWQMSDLEVSLRKKLSAGTPTRSDLLEIISICGSAGDHACRDQALSALKALEDAKR